MFRGCGFPRGTTGTKPGVGHSAVSGPPATAGGSVVSQQDSSLILLLHRLRLIPRHASLVAICKIRHVTGDCREIADLHRRIRLLARADAVDPVLHVVLIGSLASKRGSLFAVYLFGIVARGRLRASGNHILLARDVLDGAIAAKDVLAKSVVAVAERRLPDHDDILRKFERDGDGVRNFASVFL